jgi:xanthine dehydrogenase YagS FAD-binding subunit
MRPFVLEHAQDMSQLVALSALNAVSSGEPDASVQYLAGGTTLLDLMKLDVMRPQTLVNITGLAERGMNSIEATEKGLRIGALVKMADAAVHPVIARDFPVLVQSLTLAASAQLRNMATLGGNALQRTRCAYFRDVSYSACNKRIPGSGCSALDGINHSHAILGTSSACIATYPGDFAAALMALDAQLDVSGRAGDRTMPFSDLHVAPGNTPHIENTLAPGDLIVAFVIPITSFARRSRYVKVRDRQSYEFASASAAVILDIDGNTVREARVALGGLATMPWRARSVEAFLKGKVLDEATAMEAANSAFADAVVRGHNAFKISLGKATVARALLETAGMEI